MDSSSHRREHSKRQHSEERDRPTTSQKKAKDRSAEPGTAAYSELDNPFNDVNLGQQFKWHKKIEKERKAGRAGSHRSEAQRKREAKDELEQLNRRRMEREKEMQIREEEESRMSRLAETAQMADWLAKEHQFQLEQERSRAAIRIKEKRAKAIDFLCFNLRYVDPAGDGDTWPSLEADDLEIDIEEPYSIFDNLSYQQTQELQGDIQKFLSLETEQVNIDFWTNMMVICQDKIDRMKQNGGQDKSTVDLDIDRLLAGKTLDQLGLLQRQVQDKLSSGEALDVEYWENLIKTIFVAKAKSKLSTLHEVIVRNRLEQLRKVQRDEAYTIRPVPKQQPTTVQPAIPSEAAQSHRAIPYKRDMSPPLIPFNKIPLEDRTLDVIDELGDKKKIADSRRAVKEGKVATTVNLDDIAPTPDGLGDVFDTDALWRAEAEKVLEEEEEYFNTEATVSHPTTYSWGDKYRPRKPRYFNRVHTGYEWNKYNQTHYDTDNPPPKVVQGYKFNIFYPDLIDKTKAPTYKIVQELGNTDTVLLYFTAGPPYEDIAFRIVDREWEYSHKRGFRCSYDRGCLSLWFNFKRNFYRK